MCSTCRASACGPVASMPESEPDPAPAAFVCAPTLAPVFARPRQEDTGKAAGHRADADGDLAPMQYRFLAVRMKIWPSEMAGDAWQGPSFSALLATSLNSRA